MPWCPQCKSEYDKGVEVCYDCQCKLVDKLVAEEKWEPVREAFLLTAADEMEYKILEAKLGEYGIPVTRRYRGAGAVTHIYMGRSFGLDVYVPETALPKAKEILAMTMDPDQADETEASQRSKLAVHTSKRGTWGKKVLLIFVAMILIALGFLAVTYFLLFLRLI